MRDIVIIGGGFSGVAAALNVLRAGGGAFRVALVDDRPRPGLGVAYGTTRLEHLLNVAAGKMSAFPDDPDHLVRWLGERGHGYTPADFIPRALYGEYLRDLLAEGVRGGGIEVVRGRCTGLRRSGAGYAAEIDKGEREASAAVLAIGNSAPRALRARSRDGDESGLGRVIQNPWGEPPFDRIGKKDRVVLVGTGLTAVDVVLTLDAVGHRGSITAISRRGVLPRTHAAAMPRAVTVPPRELIVGKTVREATRAVREACEREMAAGGDWRTVIDALRPHTNEAWRGWSMEDRHRFCRLLRPFWDGHRHRMAPSIASRIGEHLASGRLRIVRAGVEAVETTRDGAHVIVRAENGAGRQEGEIEAAWVFNCGGPNTDPSRWNDPLIASLLEGGLATIDPLGLGIDTNEDAVVIGRGGTPTKNLYAIGPLRRPLLWESTAVPEIRVQAVAIARSLCEARATELSTTPA